MSKVDQLKLSSRIWDTGYSKTGISYFVGVTGFVAALVALYIDPNSQVSIMWIVSLIIFSLWIIVVLLSVMHDLATKGPITQKHSLIGYSEDSRILIIRACDSIEINSVLGIFQTEKNMDRFIGLAYAFYKQDKVIQVKVLRVQEELRTDKKGLQLTYLSPTFPYDDTFTNFLESEGVS